MTLTEFLLARIAEDEHLARKATGDRWSYADVDSVAGGTLYDEQVAIGLLEYDSPRERIDPRIRRTRTEEQADANGEHIARWCPARVLAECKAKRQIIARCELVGMTFPSPISEAIPRYLALPYADHPDYDEAWRP